MKKKLYEKPAITDEREFESQAGHPCEKFPPGNPHLTPACDPSHGGPIPSMS